MEYWWMVLGFNLGGWIIFSMFFIIDQFVKGTKLPLEAYLVLVVTLFLISLIWPWFF